MFEIAVKSNVINSYVDDVIKCRERPGKGETLDLGGRRKAGGSWGQHHRQTEGGRWCGALRRRREGIPGGDQQREVVWAGWWLETRRQRRQG